MKEKMHIAILSLGVCALMGIAFAVSTKEYKEKEPKLNSAPESTMSSKKFECTKSHVNATSPATREYDKNIDKMDKILVKIEDLAGDTLYLEDPCEKMKGKANTECNINNIELRRLQRQAKKLEEKMMPYEECVEKLGLLETDKEISGEVNTGGKTERKKGTTTTQEKKIQPINKWSEGAWSTCIDGKQTRTVECQSDGKKVADNTCEGKKPSVTKVCTNKTEISNEMQFSYPWVAATQSDTVFVGDLAQFTSERGGDYMYSCGTDGIKTISQLNPEGEKHGTFYCVYSSSGEKTATISYKGKIVASRTFTVKDKAEQSTKKPEQKKYKCVETDAGLDYEKKGSVTGIWDFYTGDLSDPTLMTTHEDMCIYGSGVLEYSCDSHGRKTSTDYFCARGCKDGACIK